MNRIATTLFLVICCSGFVRAAEDKASPFHAKRPFVPTSQYEPRTVAGWRVLVNRELAEKQGETATNALALLETKLKDIRRFLPTVALAELEKVPLWLGVNDAHQVNAMYHPSAEWLRDHGWNPDKARAVEIGSAVTFIAWSKGQPMMVLHELAHAYHHRVLGHGHAGIRAAYAAAKAAGTYDKVKRSSGRIERAYALNNEQEYFAELTEAWFGRNDFFPFTREELKAHDSEGFRLMESVWGR